MRIVSDGWAAYHNLTQAGYSHSVVMMKKNLSTKEDTTRIVLNPLGVNSTIGSTTCMDCEIRRTLNISTNSCTAIVYAVELGTTLWNRSYLISETIKIFNHLKPFLHDLQNIKKCDALKPFLHI